MSTAKLGDYGGGRWKTGARGGGKLSSICARLSVSTGRHRLSQVLCFFYLLYNSVCCFGFSVSSCHTTVPGS